ncbi:MULTISPECIES: TIGR03086 family metal-binding protein [Streptomyces]|uniref:TIGR03086 family metal-binding protein n=1 Tax=Streptomyces TaxID=1883 RepID=UPI001D0A48D0|nr:MULTISPECIES: TIGR03086 family metal-binding protein [Streptomyces]MCX5083288.1 TIGR03086 family metal-binding protein [Streptomyces sp. NBC_00401]UDM01401.1 TIGR03086 family protein [Streptomyces longhuiensis]
MNDIHGDNGRLGNPRGIGDLLDVAVERAVPVVRALPDGCLEAATPCAEFDVKALVNHLFQVMEQFQRLAAKQDSDFTETADRVAEGPDWRERFGEEARKLVAAWSAPGAEEGTTGAMNMPAATVGSMVLLDLTVHIWDLARATGQEYVPEGEALAVVERLAGTVAELAPTARSMGVFGEAVPEPAGASAFERLLAATGRDPRWAAPVS